MKIIRIDAIPFAIPFRQPLKFASGEITVADHVLVRIHTDEGLIGVAEAPPRPYTYGETQESIIAAITKLFAPAITGLSPLERERVRTILDRTVGNPTARAAIDMAMWDIVGQATGISVSSLLGGYTDQMRVAHMVGIASPHEMVDEAVRVRELFGITAFKIKVGGRPYRIDVAACEAIRTALGADVDLYIDGNRGWSPSESLRALREMSHLGLLFAEELCPADDVLGRRWLVSHCDIPFIADESVVSQADVTRELLGGAANAISIKTARSGFTGSQRILYQCEGLGVEVLMGNQIDGQIGTLCSVAFGAAHRATAHHAGELSNFIDMADDLLADPLEIVSGILHVRERPGLGIDIDPDKLKRYRTDG